MMDKQRKVFTKSKQALVEEFIKEVEYITSGIVDCARIGDDGFEDAIESMADEIKDRCKHILAGLNPEPVVKVEPIELTRDSPRMIFKKFLAMQMQKLPREILYQKDHEIMIHLENIALERKDISFVYAGNYYTFQQELLEKIKILLPKLRERHKQPELFDH